jgi:hypothetical protein
LNGIFTIESAQLVEEEEYEETVKEKRELPPDEAKPEEEKKEGDAPMPESGEEKKDGEPAADAKPEEAKKEEKKEPEKKYEWVEVKKTKKRTKRTDLKITVTGKPGMADVDLQKRQDEETAMVAEMTEIIDTDEKRNDLESYIFSMRDKCSESGTYGAFISQADREKFDSELAKAEDWLYDSENLTKVQFIEKLSELRGTGDAVVWRFKEDEMRGDWIQAVAGTINNYRAAAETPGDKYGHIAADKLAKISAGCGELEKWLGDMKVKQESVSKSEKPLLICADMEKKNQELAKMADEILKEPKPAPPKEEKKEEKKEEAPAEGAPATDGAADAPADGPKNMDVD